MNHIFNHKQFLAYQALGRSLIVRLYRIALLLSQSLLHFSLDLWLYTTIISNIIYNAPNIHYTIPGLLLGLVGSEMMSETSFNLYFAKFKGHLYSMLASPMNDFTILMSYISSGIFRGAVMLTLAMLCTHLIVGIQVTYPLQFVLLIFLIAIFFCMIGLLEGIYGTSFMQSGFTSRLVFNILWTFSGALGRIPAKEKWAIQIMNVNPLYYMNNMIRYYMLGVAEFVPQNILLLQIALLNLILFLIVMQCFKGLRK